MLDILGAIMCAGIYTAQLGILTGYATAPSWTKRLAVGAATLWGAGVVLIAALGDFQQGATGVVPTPVLAFGVLLVFLLGSFALSQRFRDAMLSIPLPALIGLNAARTGGIMFILLGAAGRLSSPFAPAAGGGDILVGALAVPAALLAAKHASRHTALIGAWNLLGALDLVMAITIALLSSPGLPLRIFMEGQGTLVMTGLPWIMVPTLIVPFYFLIHLTVATKLKALQTVRSEIAMARAH
jgi:hypothetical protein